MIAKLFSVSLDDLLMDERAIDAGAAGADEESESRCSGKRKEEIGYYVNRETANGFLLYYKKKFLLIGGLLFLIVFGLLSLFIPMAGAERIVCLIGVAIFLGFTAYDTQKIRTYYRAYQSDAAMLERASIISALQLYLDFINLFLYLLRFLGKNRK